MNLEWWDDNEMMEWHSNDRMSFKWQYNITRAMVNGMTEWHSNDWMTFKWLNDTQMTFLYRNELGMMGWQWNDGMRFKWHEWPLDEWNGIQMTEWHSNDRMTFKWWNDTQMRFLDRNELGMMGWQWNDGMRFKWHEWPLDEWNGI